MFGLDAGADAVSGHGSASALELYEERMRVGVPDVLAVMLLGGQPGGNAGHQLDVPLHFAGEQPPREGTERIHDAVRVLVQGRLVARPVGVLQYPHAVILEDHFVVIGIGYNGVEFHRSMVVWLSTLTAVHGLEQGGGW